MKLKLGDAVRETATGREGSVVGLGEFLYAKPKALVFLHGDGTPASTGWVDLEGLETTEGRALKAVVHGGYPLAAVATA